MAGRRSPKNPAISRLTWLLEEITSSDRRSRHTESQHNARRHRPHSIGIDAQDDPSVSIYTLGGNGSRNDFVARSSGPSQIQGCRSDSSQIDCFGALADTGPRTNCSGCNSNLRRLASAAKWKQDPKIAAVSRANLGTIARFLYRRGIHDWERRSFAQGMTIMDFLYIGLASSKR